MTTVPTIEYICGADLDDLGLFVRANRALIDLSTGHSFTLVVGDGVGPTTGFTKTTSMVGAVGSDLPPEGVPNLIVTWETSGELNDIDPGRYKCELTILRTTDQRQRKRQFYLQMLESLS